VFYFQSLLCKFNLEALLQVTHYPLLASAESVANGFWQIVSINLMPHCGERELSKVSNPNFKGR